MKKLFEVEISCRHAPRAFEQWVKEMQGNGTPAKQPKTVESLSGSFCIPEKKNPDAVDVRAFLAIVTKRKKKGVYRNCRLYGRVFVV